MSRFWNSYPMFRLIIPFALGIILAIGFGNLGIFTALDLIVIPGGLFLLTLVAHLLPVYRLRWLTGLTIYCFLLVSGYSLTIIRTPLYQQTHFMNHPIPGQQFILQVGEPPIEKARSVRVIGNVKYLIDTAGTIKSTGKILVYLQKDSLSMGLQYGDLLILYAPVSEVGAPANPHQFNYKRYLANSGIYFQAYADNKSWKKMAGSRTNPLLEFSYNIRQKMLIILESTALTGDEFAVAAAILLGYDENMEPELRESYAGAGAMHVLCVSGLHVGVIFFILSYLLKGLDKRKKARLFKVIVLLLSIWVYALITGLSPSVLRASVMFSFFAVREYGKHKSNPYNILAASAFLLLLIDPFIITKVGFQLSYAAVLAIIALFNPIYKIVVFKNVIFDNIWKLLVVSLAAQIGTFPIAVYYFHQFPLYFFLTNLIVIPLVWLVIYIGIFVLVSSFIWQLLSLKLSAIFYVLLWILNTSVAWINDFPDAKIDGLILSVPQIILIYGSLILITRFFIRKHGKYLVVSMVLILLLVTSFVFNRYDRMQQRKLVVYDVPGHTALDVFWGRNLIAFSDSVLIEENAKVDYNIQPNRVFSGSEGILHIPFESKAISANLTDHLPVRLIDDNFLLTGNKRIVIIDDRFEDYRPANPMQVDLVILRNNPKISIDRIMQLFRFQQMVFDASNWRWKVKEWRKKCMDADIDFHDVKSDGAFEYEIEPQNRNRLVQLYHDANQL